MAENDPSRELLPYALTFPDAVVYSGISRTVLFQAIRAGELEARQNGRKTLVMGDSLRAFLDRLPPASPPKHRTDHAPALEHPPGPDRCRLRKSPPVPLNPRTHVS